MTPVLELVVGGVVGTAIGSTPVVALVGQRRRARELDERLRHELHVAELERELGIGAAGIDALDERIRAATDVSLRGHDPRGYQGPALTDADVRRLEHPDEFA